MNVAPFMSVHGSMRTAFPRIVCGMVAVAALAIAGQSARAELKTYIITTLNQSGTVGSTSFTDAAIRFSYTGNTAAISGNSYSMSGTSINFSVFGGNLSSPLNGTFSSADNWQLSAFASNGAWAFTVFKSGLYIPGFQFRAPQADMNAQAATTFANNQAMLLSSYSQTVTSLPSGGTTSSFTFTSTGGAAPSANWSSFGQLGSGVSSSLGTFRINSPSSTTYYNGSIQTVPEPSTYAMALAGLAFAGWSMRRRAVRRCGLSINLAASLALAAAFLGADPIHAAPVTIDWVTVGNPGNTADGNGKGSVGEVYRIGKYEVTVGQYSEFLNAVAATDTYSLYDLGLLLTNSVKGINRTGVSGSYQYAPIGSANKPVAFVTWWQAARFANWMHNGQPTGAQGNGTTETGAYTLNGATSGTAPARNPGATVFLPTSNEWYKAAYYSPTKSGSGGYYTYATQTDSSPGNVVGSGSNQANFRSGGGTIYSVTQSSSFDTNQNYLTNVGAFTNSASYYGTFDQNGNVAEWSSPVTPASSLELWGGGWNQGIVDLMKGFPSGASTNYRDAGIGFRIAAVPEPSTYAMALAGLACGSWMMQRRKRRASCH